LTYFANPASFPMMHSTTNIIMASINAEYSKVKVNPKGISTQIQ